jgi:hypothetical protein
MDEKCVCHINGYRLKDTEARRKATTAGEMANAAMEKAIDVEGQIAKAETMANRAKTTADGAVVTAKAAHTTAEAAEKAAAAAQTTADGAALAAKVAGNTANGKVSREGDTMEGALDMGNHQIENVSSVNARSVILRERGGEVDVTVEAYEEPGTVRFVCPAKGNRVIVRGVADPVAPIDATPKKWVEEQLSKKGETPDWLQNDPAALDYIKNRTHYTVVTEGEITLTINPGAMVGTGVTDRIYEQRETAKYASAVCAETLSYWFDTEDGAGDFLLYDGITVIRGTRRFNNNIQFYKARANESVYTAMDGELVSVDVTFTGEVEDVHQIDPKYIPNGKPLILSADNAETYLNDPTPGDEALEAVKIGRQILVRVPNASGDNYVASYSPVYMYQVPNQTNSYLYLFFLRDEKQDLSALLGQPAGTVLMPVYGQLKMKLSKEHNENPLET